MSARYEDRRYRSAAGASKLRYLLSHAMGEGQKPSMIDISGCRMLQHEVGLEVCQWAVEQGLVKEVREPGASAGRYERTSLGEEKLRGLGS